MLQRKIFDQKNQPIIKFKKKLRFFLFFYTRKTKKMYFCQILKYYPRNFQYFLFQNELCAMLVDCCAQQRTYERFYGMLIERFCRLRLEYQQYFEKLCQDTYSTIHRIDITKLRNLARLIAHLLSTDAIDWKILADMKMTEEDTTSSGRIYIKYIFNELVEAMGMVKLHSRVTDPWVS